MIKERKGFLVDKAKVEKKLGELSSSGKQKLSGVLNEWFDRITEFQLSYSNQDIVKKLNEAGIEITETQFRDTMFRVRRKRGLTKNIASQKKPKPPKPIKPDSGAPSEALKTNQQEGEKTEIKTPDAKTGRDIVADGFKEKQDTKKYNAD